MGSALVHRNQKCRLSNSYLIPPGIIDHLEQKLEGTVSFLAVHQNQLGKFLNIPTPGSCPKADLWVWGRPSTNI